MRTSNSTTALAVCCIWSMASSIAVIRFLMSTRSNGVMKVRRTAVSTSRVILSASFSNWLTRWQNTGVSSPPRSMSCSASALHDGLGMPGKQVEKPLLSGQKGTKPAQHLKGPSLRKRPARAACHTSCHKRFHGKRAVIGPGTRSSTALSRRRRRKPPLKANAGRNARFRR